MPADGYDTALGAVQPRQPNIARVYDYWLGGKVNTAADRALADQLEARFPGRARGAVENRAFLARAVPCVAEQGVRQFIDAGSGLPTVQNTHDLARAAQPGAAVVYADCDPVVVAHARQLLAGGAGLAVVQADLQDPRGLVGVAAATGVVSLAEPVCVIAALVLPFFPPDEAHAVVAGLTAGLVPGSYLIVSSWCCPDPDVYAEIAAAYTAGELQNHMPETVAGWLAGLDLMAPGITDIRSWGTWLAEDELPRRRLGMLIGAVARVP